MPGPDDGAVSSGTLARVAAALGDRRRLRRLRRLAGLGPYAVRILYVIVSICSVAFPGTLVYIILWIVMPQARRSRPLKALSRVMHDGHPPANRGRRTRVRIAHR